jgi:cytochrome c556
MHRDPVLRPALISALVVTVFGALMAGGVHAQGQPSRGEKTLKYRKAVYQVIAWNFGPLSAMAQDKEPFDATAFAMHADRVAGLTPMLLESYSSDTRNVADSKLKPEMWSNREDFEQKMQTLVDRSAALAQVADGTDAAASKAAFYDLAKACKACHDKYRAD